MTTDQPRAGDVRTRGDVPTSVGSMDPTHDIHPAFEACPSAGAIARWFIDNMRQEPNRGGDAWWLSRDPHGSCYMVAHVDRDVQEFWLLDITTNDVSDLLFVMNGLDGEGVTWWQNPRTHPDAEWITDGLRWMADQIEVHYDYLAMRQRGEIR
jgi:hypothetical protein